MAPPSIIRANSPEANERFRSMAARQLAAEQQRQKQQGRGKPIISTVFQGYRVVAVGNRIFYSKNWKTVPDFLMYYIKSVLGPEWGNPELARPYEKRHPILQWYHHVVQKQHETIKEPGIIHSAEITGAIAAYLHLAYDLYLIAHNERLQSRLVERLKTRDLFEGALYELRVAAAFVRAGFRLEFENEEDFSTTHCEFTATYIPTGSQFSVEAKGHLQSDSSSRDRFRWGRRLQRALAKKANHTRIIFLDTNAPDDVSEEKIPRFMHHALARIRRFEDRKFEGDKLPPAYVFVTNFPYHHHLEGTTFRNSVLAEGFKISDFKLDAEFQSIHEAVLARDKHIEMHQLMLSFRQYTDVPSTFEGENPEFTEEDLSNRLLIGNSYSVPDSDGKEQPGKLILATVWESERSATGVFQLQDGREVMVKCPLSDSELRAYHRHPDTFFGEYKEDGRKLNDALDAYDWVLSCYRNTPKHRLLELLKAQDAIDMKELSQFELAKLYAERIATAMMALVGTANSNSG